MRTKILSARLLSFLAAICFCGDVAQAVPILQYSPGGPYAVTAGATLSVDVEITNLAGDIVSAYDLDVQYNPALLTNSSVTFGTLLGDASLFEVLESAVGPDTAPGLIDFAALSLLSDPDLLALQAPNATVYLATLHFVALADGLASLNFVFGPGDDVKCSNGAQCIPSIPEPGSIALLLAGLLGYGVTTRATASRRRS